MELIKIKIPGKGPGPFIFFYFLDRFYLYVRFPLFGEKLCAISLSGPWPVNLKKTLHYLLFIKLYFGKIINKFKFLKALTYFSFRVIMQLQKEKRFAVSFCFFFSIFNFNIKLSL